MSEEVANTKKCALVGVVAEHIQAEIHCDLDRTMATMADKHIYWDQASFRSQIGFMDPPVMPIAVNHAAKILDPSLPNLIYKG